MPDDLTFTPVDHDPFAGEPADPYENMHGTGPTGNVAGSLLALGAAAGPPLGAFIQGGLSGLATQQGIPQTRNFRCQGSESHCEDILAMTKSIAICSLIAAATIVIVCTMYKPAYLSDQNDFLQDFVKHGFLELLGIIITITLASAANLHLEFNKIEERFNRRGLTKTRRGVTQGAYYLIGLFLISVVIVVVKPLAPQTDTFQSLFNGAALIVLLWNVLILLELTQLAFAIPAEIKPE